MPSRILIWVLWKSVCRNLYVNRSATKYTKQPNNTPNQGCHFWMICWITGLWHLMTGSVWTVSLTILSIWPSRVSKTLDQIFFSFEFYKSNSYCSSPLSWFAFWKKPSVIYHMRSLYTTSTKEYEEISTNIKEKGYS